MRKVDFEQIYQAYFRDASPNRCKRQDSGFENNRGCKKFCVYGKFIFHRHRIFYTLIPIMTLLNGYLLIFYTNICGMAPKACASLFLIARILDGLNDPIVGLCIDRMPNTRFGHFRMPLIVGTVLCGLNYLLLWFGPMMAPSGKLVIAYISYHTSSGSFYLGI